MDNAIRKGSICKFDATIDFAGFAEEKRSVYKHMRRMNAEWYIVLRNIDEKEILCVPVYKEKRSFWVSIVINKESYYADYMDFLVAQTDWISNADIKMNNPKGVVDRIYEMRKTCIANKLEKQRKKQKEKQEDRRFRKEIQTLEKSKFPKEQPSSTVAWNMMHPFQGGRTGSK